MHTTVPQIQAVAQLSDAEVHAADRIVAEFRLSLPTAIVWQLCAHTERRDIGDAAAAPVRYCFGYLPLQALCVTRVSDIGPLFIHKGVHSAFKDSNVLS